jgi:hypothetical protein
VLTLQPPNTDRFHTTWQSKNECRFGVQHTVLLVSVQQALTASKNLEMDQGSGFQRIGAFRPIRAHGEYRSIIGAAGFAAGWLPVQAAKPGINPLPDPL